MGYYFDDRNSAAWSYGDDAGRIIDLLGIRFMGKILLRPLSGAPLMSQAFRRIERRDICWILRGVFPAERMAKLSMPPPTYTVRRPRAPASWWSATVLFRCG